MSVLIDAAAQPSAYALTAGRLWSIVATLVGVAGVIIGGLALARTRRRGTTVAMAAGLAGMIGGGLVVAAADGGPGTGYGIVGGYVALVIGLIAMALGGLARSRRSMKRAAQ